MSNPTGGRGIRPWVPVPVPLTSGSIPAASGYAAGTLGVLDNKKLLIVIASGGSNHWMGDLLSYSHPFEVVTTSVNRVAGVQVAASGKLWIGTLYPHNQVTAANNGNGASDNWDILLRNATATITGASYNTHSDGPQTAGQWYHPAGISVDSVETVTNAANTFGINLRFAETGTAGNLYPTVMFTYREVYQ